MAQYEESSIQDTFFEEEDLSNKPLRPPRMSSFSSDERTDTPPKSVLQKRKLHGGKFEAPAAFLAPANKTVQEEAPKNKCVLRADADVFVPRAVSFVVPISKFPSVQDRLKKDNLSERYNCNMKDNFNQEDNVLEDGIENIQINNGYGVVNSIVETLETFVINLTRDPGLFNKIQEMFLSFLNPYFNDPKNNVMVIYDTALMLFMHSVENTNFRYSGAKLCLILGECSPEFQANLHLLCEKDTNSNTKNHKGLLLFIAELYMNRTDNSKMFGNMLVTGFDLLLITQSEDNVVAACQIIKLTGGKLSMELPVHFNNVLHKLEQLKPSMRNNIRNLIESVSKNSQVQYSSDSNEVENASIPGMEDTNTTPILIGQDGIEVEDEIYSGDDDSDMEEMYKQYEEFLKEVNK